MNASSTHLVVCCTSFILSRHFGAEFLVGGVKSRIVIHDVYVQKARTAPNNTIENVVGAT